MKNSIKKVLCTAVAAVSLSALVTVPSSLNKPDSDNAIVTVMEANADDFNHFMAYKYVAFITPGKNYYTRRNPWKNNNNIIPESELKKGTKYEKNCNLWHYKQVYVYEESGNWVRISPDDETYNGKKRERWVYKPRIQRTKPGSQDGHDHSHMDYDEFCTVITAGANIYDEYVCTYCGKRWLKKL